MFKVTKVTRDWINDTLVAEQPVCAVDYLQDAEAVAAALVEQHLDGDPCFPVAFEIEGIGADAKSATVIQLDVQKRIADFNAASQMYALLGLGWPGT
jgi:hypothetical protein